MRRLGIPAESILLETKATNTGENVLFTYDMLKSMAYLPNSMLLLQKPYMLRRTYATFMKQWPGAENIKIEMSSLPIPFELYFDKDQPFGEVILIMVGDLERIIEYPKLGFQVVQYVPKKVVDAQRFLIRSGFNKHLLQQ